MQTTWNWNSNDEWYCANIYIYVFHRSKVNSILHLFFVRIDAYVKLNEYLQCNRFYVVAVLIFQWNRLSHSSLVHSNVNRRFLADWFKSIYLYCTQHKFESMLEWIHHLLHEPNKMVRRQWNKTEGERERERNSILENIIVRTPIHTHIII